MKIALVIPGGIDRSREYRVIPALMALVRQLSRIHELHVFTLAGDTEPGSWVMDGAKIHDLGRCPSVWRTLRALLQEHRRAPFVLVQSIWSGRPGSVAVLAGKVLRIPSAIHIAGGELAAVREIGYGAQLRWAPRTREALLLRFANALTAASTPILEQIAARGRLASRVPLGVDLDAWPPLAPRQRAPNETARLVHVASLNRVKDQPTLLAALARLALGGLDFTLDICGEDILRGEVQRIAAASGLEKYVHFHGLLTPRDLYARMREAHLNIVSSRHEAGPLVALEAAVLGVPTVGTAVGHLIEWTPDAAVTVPVADAEALAAAIAAVLGDEQRRLSLARAAQRRAVAEDSANTARLFDDVYRMLVGASP